MLPRSFTFVSCACTFPRCKLQLSQVVRSWGYPMHAPFTAQIALPPVCAAAQVSVLTNDGKHYVVRVSMYMAAKAQPTACMRLALPVRG